MQEHALAQAGPRPGNHSMHDHRMTEWYNFPIEEFDEIFPSTVKCIEACGTLFNHLSIRDPIGSHRVPVLVVGHLVHDLIAKDHNFRHKVIDFDI